MRLLVSVLLAGCLFATPVALAQRGFNPAGTPPGGLPFSVDFAVFPQAGSKAQVNVFLSVPLNSLSPDPGLRGRVSVMVIFYNSGGDQITGDEWDYHDIPLGKTPQTNVGRSLNRNYAFELSPGKVQATVRVSDPIRDRQGERVVEFKVPDFSKEDLEVAGPVYGFCRESIASAPDGSFYGPVLPHPSRRYGKTLPAACIFYEIHDYSDVDADYTVRYKLKSSFGETHRDTSFTVSRKDKQAELLLQPSFEDLITGSYTLELEVGVGKYSATSKSSFSIDESRMAIRQDPGKLRTLMKYIATNQEKYHLEAVPDDSLSFFWEAFWQRRDPDLDTAGNEALAQFLSRVAIATEQFGVLEPGWRADRGRIYIKFGKPDQIEEFYTETYRYPTLIWYYYDRSRNYVFQDQEGFGRYRLVGMRED